MSPAEPDAKSLAIKRASWCRVLALALLLAALPQSGEAAALEECRTEAADRSALDACLEALDENAAAALERAYAAAAEAQVAIDAITGTSEASRSLALTQQAWALYRDLDCQTAGIQVESGASADQRRQACSIDHTRERVARLQALVSEPPALASPLLGTAWQVETIDGEPVARDGAAPPTLAIDKTAGIAGNTGCNRYFGTAEITADDLALVGLGSTRMACPEPAMALEQRLLAALERVAGWRIDTQTLRLTDGSGAPLLELSPIE